MKKTKARKMGTSEYLKAWIKQEQQWKNIRKWERMANPNAKPLERTHLMDFASGWCAAVRAGYESIGKLLN